MIKLTYGRQILAHYLSLLMQVTNRRVDSDNHTEWDGIFEEIEVAFYVQEVKIKDLEDQVAALESRILHLVSRMNAEVWRM